MQCVATFNNGITDVGYCSIREAVHDIAGQHPDLVIVDAGGFERTPSSPDSDYDVRDGRIALIWHDCEDAGLSGTGDDGSRSIAELRIS